MLLNLPAPPQAKPWLPAGPEAHGALNYSELENLGLDPAQIIDFSSNINPYGPAPGVRQALVGCTPERYPDRQALALRRALSAQLGIAAEQILPGSGCAELIWLAALAYLQPGDTVLVVGPTFGEYAHAAQLAGAQVETCPAAPPGFVVAADTVTQRLGSRAYRLAFICNPNNPTGQAVPPETIAAWAAAAPDTLLVVDEAYIHFAPHLRSVLPLGQPNLLLLRSMTKEYALAGLRLGYAVAHPQIIRALAAVQPPWSVSAPAQAAGLAALAAHAQMLADMRRLQADRQQFQAWLRAAGLQPLPSETAFFLLPAGRAAAWRLALLHQGLQVRDCASFGLPGYLRIATRRPEENEKLARALVQTAQEIDR